jgi:general secretion pathway protein A
VPAAFDLPTGFAYLMGAERQAWEELAQAWSIDIAGQEPCAAARKQQVQCFRSSKVTLATIRLLDRPGILTLRDGENRAAYAMLDGLTNKSATLRIGGERRTVSLVSLADYWRGEFATLWRVPPGYPGKDSAGRPSADARWLAQQLAALRGDSRPIKSPVDEADLRGRVHAFQLTQGLPSDGIAGPVTLMQLNRGLGIGEPHLEAEK